MRISFYLYPYYDTDLLALRSSPYLDFRKFARDAVIKYSKGREYRISPQYFPYSEEEDIFPVEKIRDKNGKVYEKRKGIQVFISINEKRYPETIELLKRVPERRMTSFVKSVLRKSIECDLPKYFIESTSDGLKETKPKNKESNPVKPSDKPVLANKDQYPDKKLDSGKLEAKDMPVEESDSGILELMKSLMGEMK